MRGCFIYASRCKQYDGVRGCCMPLGVNSQRAREGVVAHLCMKTRGVNRRVL